MFNENRQFGVEIEVYGLNRQAAAGALRAAGIKCKVVGETHMHDDFKSWKAVEDGSLGGWGCCEVVSPILKGKKGLKKVKKVIDILKKAGASVNENCGLHVHHDTDDLSPMHCININNFYSAFNTTIDNMVNYYRRANRCSYAKTNEPITKVTKIITKNDIYYNTPPGRYYKVNLQAIESYGTIEFRHHHGTLDAKEVEAWIRFTQAIVENGKHKYQGKTDWFNLVKILKLNTKLAFYLYSKETEFKFAA